MKPTYTRVLFRWKSVVRMGFVIVRVNNGLVLSLFPSYKQLLFAITVVGDFLQC